MKIIAKTFGLLLMLILVIPSSPRKGSLYTIVTFKVQNQTGLYVFRELALNAGLSGVLIKGPDAFQLEFSRNHQGFFAKKSTVRDALLALCYQYRCKYKIEKKEFFLWPAG